MSKWFRIVYVIMAWLFVIGVLAQVYLAGMVVVAGRMGWSNHVGLGHSLGIPLLLMLVAAYAGRLPGSLKRLTWLLFVVYIIQADVIIFLRGSFPFVAAFHPVLALVDFALGVAIARKAWALARQPLDATAPAFDLSPRRQQPAG